MAEKQVTFSINKKTFAKAIKAAKDSAGLHYSALPSDNVYPSNSWVKLEFEEGILKIVSTDSNILLANNIHTLHGNGEKCEIVIDLKDLPQIRPLNTMLDFIMTPEKLIIQDGSDVYTVHQYPATFPKNYSALFPNIDSTYTTIKVNAKYLALLQNISSEKGAVTLTFKNNSPLSVIVVKGINKKNDTEADMLIMPIQG